MNLTFLLLLGATSLGLAEALNGHYLKKFDKVTSVGLIIVGSVMTFLISLTTMLVFKMPFTPIGWLEILLISIIGLCSYFANKNFYNSFKIQEASTSTIIVMATIVITTIYGRVVFQEQVQPLQWLGVALVMVAVFLVNMGGLSREAIRKVLKPTTATKLVLIAALLYGIANGTSKLLVQDLHPLYYQFLDVVIITPIFLLLDNKEARSQIAILQQTRAYRVLAGIIPLYFLYNFFRYFVFSEGMELPLADAIDNFVVFIIFAVEILIFKIKPKNLLFKLGAAAIAVLGVLLISFF